MDDSEDKVNYELMGGDNPTIYSRICSCLYTYTVGSCLYFNNDEEDSDQKAKVQIELKALVSESTQQTKGKSAQEESDEIMNSEWKKKTFLNADCKMKKRIQYHFDDHIERWIKRPDRRRFPWTPILHLVLVALVTTQVVFHAFDKFKITSFLIEANNDFRHYFTYTEGSNNCDGEVKLYTIDDVYNQIQLIVEKYYSSPDQVVALSSLCHAEIRRDNTSIPTLNMIVEYLELELCNCNRNLSETFPDTRNSFTLYRELFVVTSNDTDDNEDEPMNGTCDDSNITCCSRKYCSHSIHDQVKYFININNLYRIELVKFSMNLPVTIYQKGVIEDYNAVEVEFNASVTIKTHDHLHTSHVTVESIIEQIKLRRQCTHKAIRTKNIVINCLVIVFSVLAFISYSLSVIGASQLAQDAKLHFLVYHKKRLRWQEIHILFNKFYIVMLFTCILLVIATVLDIINDHGEWINLNLIEAASILLGIGVFLLWCCLFAFLKYFETLSVLLITLKLAMPSVLRFAVCMVILFLAFMLCGWLIFGHYNPRFEVPLVASETLIGIIYGNGLVDAFDSTSSSTVARSMMLSIFGKIYLILFLFVFIYIVLSLFIGIFDQAYQSLSNNWRNRSRGFLLDWAEDEPDNDLTKNYPFPVPRIRDLPSEFSTDHFSPNSHSVPSTKETSKNSANTEDAVSNDAIPLPNVANSISHTSSDEEEAESRQNTLVHYSSDSKLHSCHIKPAYNHRTVSTSFYTRSPRRHHRRARSRLHEHRGSFIKSIAQEPPDASEQDVARAQAKLFNKSQKLEMSDLQEADI